ncbi:biotin--[acetyl-CoA-carboxylase] ligase [Dyadobacter psychrotolerans]|uniref:biotin--[acetyl-CoA-carboxylase] ligase n=1 Tax=Dyadobacter psychrotolerans TaxID=2541721 RepID=UPI001E2ABAEA|nr:biotin--[acetyl-CoA-carboxylase] ligase [Dyadobacter psychrotolerans]
MIYLPSCHSTNDIAAELVLNGLAEEGTVVITDNQVGGRGQRGTKWLSEPSQNLTFSVILRPKFLPVAEQFLISQMVALAIYDYFSFYTNQVKIKWPNDIYISSKKVSGTLIENAVQGYGISSSIVGIGININQTRFETARSTSLAEALGTTLNLQSEFEKLGGLLDAGYLRLKTMKQNQVIRDLYLKGLHGYQNSVKFNYLNERVAGVVTGIENSGRLLVKLEGKEGIYDFGLKEIEWVWDE